MSADPNLFNDSIYPAGCPLDAPDAFTPLPPANSPQPAAPITPYAGRPRPPETGLRLLPLGSFVWGGPARPDGVRSGRTRGDHCLMRVTAGVMRIILPSGAVDHGAGSVIFLPAGTAFATDPQAGVAGQALLMQRDMGRRLALPNRILVGTGASDAFSADIAALAMRSHDPIASATAACRLELIAATLHRLAARPEPAGHTLPGQDSHALVEAYCELAGREMGRGRTIADLAEALGTTAGGLDMACRRQRGCSALDLIYKLRVERAVALLPDRTRSLAQIAEDLGFTGTAHLNRVLMAFTGRPAEAFRAQA